MTKTRNSALGTLSPGVAMAVCSAACGDPVTLPGPVPQPLPFVAVQSLTPAPNARAAPRDGALLITFDRPLDRSRPESLDVRVFGRWSGVAEVTLELGEQDRALRIRPSEPFAAGEEVTATLVAGSYGGTEGEFGLGHTWTFRTASAAGSFAQRGIATLPVRRPGEAHIQAYGAYDGDLNGDGWSDLILPNEQSVDIRIFLNDGAGGYGNFTIVPVPGGVDPSTNEGADLDGDGDLVATAFNANRVALFRNSGGTFSRIGTMDVGDGEWSCAPGDVNGDGLMDVFVGTRRSDEVITLASRGDGDLEILTSDFDSGHFVISENAGGRFLRRPEVLAARTAASCAILHDRDNDGDLDITGIDEIDDLLFLFENVGG